MGVSPKSVEQRIAEAVARERERCCAAICGLCAGHPTYGPAIFETPEEGLPAAWVHPNVLTGNPWDAMPCRATEIRARAREKTE